MDELAVTRLWMGGVIAIMLIYALIALAGHRRSRKSTGRVERDGQADSEGTT